MPMVNGRYKSPTWVDGGRPALNAAELQAITSTLEAAYVGNDAVSAATLAKFGLPETCVPDHVLSTIADYMFGSSVAQYRWLRTRYEYKPAVSGAESTVVDATWRNGNFQVNIVYSNEIQMSEDGTISLVNPQSQAIPTMDGYSDDRYVPKGTYFKYVSCDSTQVQVSAKNTTDVFTYVRQYRQRSDSSNDAAIEIIGHKVVREAYTISEIVASDDQNAYPSSGTAPDGWTYTTIEPVVAKFGLVETGDYIGTGTFGSANRTAISFSKPPRAVLVFKEGGTNVNAGNGLVWVGQATVNSCTVTVNGNSFAFYSTTAANQLNVSGTTYHYIGIM